VIAFSFGRGAHEEAARVRREGLDVHLVTVADLMDRLDDVSGPQKSVQLIWPPSAGPAK
jgi:hypothetical protein